MSIFLSIITPTFNSSKFINTNLQSVIDQNYLNLEHIFIDNNSDDQTLKILENYKKKVNFKVKIISEKDNGIYDAFNKGLEIANGKIVTILNSDDFFLNKNILNNVEYKFLTEKVDVLYGDIKILSRNNLNHVIRNWKSQIIQKEYYKVPHPSFFISRSFNLNKYKFNLDYKIAADLDYIIKVFKDSPKVCYVDKFIVGQRAGGTSQKFFNIIKANWETFKIIKSNQIDNKIYFLIKKILFKLRQF